MDNSVAYKHSLLSKSYSGDRSAGVVAKGRKKDSSPFERVNVNRFLLENKSVIVFIHKERASIEGNHKVHLDKPCLFSPGVQNHCCTAKLVSFY